jgi:hypothetical protein
MNQKMDRAKALEILGIGDNATDEQIENRYSLLLKKLRTQEKQHRDQSIDTDKPNVTIDDVNAAYNSLKGIEGQQLNKVKMGWNKEWFAHFFHYYKMHTIVAIILLIVLGFTINGAIEREQQRKAEALLPKPDVGVVFVGNYRSEEIPKIEETLLKEFPEWKRIKVDIIYRPLDPNGPMDPAYLQKSVIDLMTKKGDVYIMDKVNYDQLIEQEFLEDSKALGIKSGDLSQSKIWQAVPLVGTDQKQAAVAIDAVNKENAIKFIEKIEQIK